MHHRTEMAVVMTAALLIGAPLSAQEDDVRRDFTAWVAAWSAQDAEAWCSYWMSDYQGFNYAGGLLAQTSACDPTSVQASFDAGFDPSVGIRHLTVRVHGDFAAVACYFVGTITFASGDVISGPWRFTAAMIKDGGTWKGIQYHFSPLDPM